MIKENETQLPAEKITTTDLLSRLKSQFDAAKKPRGSNDNPYDEWGDDD